jgi:hypothetical protein
VDGRQNGTVGGGGAPLRLRLLEGEATWQRRFKGEMGRSQQRVISATRLDESDLQWLTEWWHTGGQWRQLGCARREKGPGWAVVGPNGQRLGPRGMGPKPALVISKENFVGLPKGFWAKMKDQVERPAEMAFKFKQGFLIQKSKIQILFKTEFELEPN